jgi:hypothetical protein
VTRSKEGPTAQEAAMAHQTAGLSTPRANLRLAREPGAAPRSLRLARGPNAPSGESAPRSRDRDPSRASLRLTRGRLDPRHRTYSPDQSI